MNIINKHFYIFSILIHLNSSMIVHIHIDKNELKEKGLKCQFNVIMVKWSENQKQWEYPQQGSKGKLITSAGYASLNVPKKWEHIYRENLAENKPFWLAIKVTIIMIGKLIEIDPLSFILKKDQHLFIDLNLLDNGEIIGSINETGQNLGKRLKDTEIGVDEHRENHPQKRQKLTPENYSPFPLHQQEHWGHQNSLQTENLATASGQIRPIDHHKQQGNIPPMNETENPKEFWEQILQNLPQTQETTNTEEEEDELDQFIKSGFTHHGPIISEDIGGRKQNFEHNLQQNLPIDQIAKTSSLIDADYFGEKKINKNSSHMENLITTEGHKNDQNYSMFINIKIDKSGLKNEQTKLFEGTDGQFRVKMTKKLENDEWEDDPMDKYEVTNSAGSVQLDVPKKYKTLFIEHKSKTAKPFWLAVKVEMVDNKSIEPIPFKLAHKSQKVLIHLKEEENGKIFGISSGPGKEWYQNENIPL